MLAGSAWEFIFGMPQIAVIMGCLIPIASIIASFWYKAQKVQSENELKRTLVEQGLSADDIERIIRAKAIETPDSDR